MAVAVGCSKLQPACRLMRIARRAGEIKTAKFVLRVGVTEIGCRIAEHVTRAGAIGHDFRIRYASQIVMAEGDEGIGNEARLRRAGRLIGMTVGDLAEIAERAQIISWHAIAIGIHAAELPLRHGLPLIGGILQRRERTGLAWCRFRGMCARAQSLARRQSSRAWRGGAVECVSRRGAKETVNAVVSRIQVDRGRQANSGQCSAGQETAEGARYPHSTPSRPLHPDGSVRR